MKEEDKLKRAFGCDTGMHLPEGFFDDFRQRMSESLPEYPEAPAAVRLTAWQRLRPYVYLAAMFLGIWCMMKVFHDVSERASARQDAVPESVVLAMSDNSTGDYVVEMEETDFCDIELETSLCDQYSDISEFEDAFDYDLKPEYASIEIHS